MAEEGLAVAVDSRLVEVTVALREAQREAALAEAAHHRAEAAKMWQGERWTKVDADLHEIDLASRQRTEDLELARDINHHVYIFDCEVTQKSVGVAIAGLASWHHKDPGCDITIQITSPGGDIIQGLALVDYLRWLRWQGHKVTCVTYGWAASMGGVLLQAGDHRVMGKNALLLIHEGSMGVVGDYAKVQDTVSLMKTMHQKILDMFMERATCSRRFIVKNWERRDWWLTAEEALKHGFIDEIW